MNGEITPLKKTALLGVIDEKIRSSEATSYSVNKIGGYGDFDDDSKSTSKCRLCGDPQALVAQIYCPLDDSPYHRTIYVLCCVKPECWSKCLGWTVLRQMSFDENVGRKSASIERETWGVDEDSWGDDTWESENEQDDEYEGMKTASALSLELQQLQLNETGSCQSRPNSILGAARGLFFEAYYVNVHAEADCFHGVLPGAKDKLKNKVTEGTDMDDLCGFSDKCKLAGEKYEPATYKDRTFHKFWKYIKTVPEQVIRYCLSGLPILPKDEKPSPLPCVCGASRVFELQLMPSLLPYLKTDGVSVEFSTILIYTCSKNCVHDSKYSVLEETLVYFDDPDLSYFKGQKCMS